MIENDRQNNPITFEKVENDTVVLWSGWEEGCAKMCGIELDGRIRIGVDVSRYIIGGPTTTMDIYWYV